MKRTSRSTFLLLVFATLSTAACGKSDKSPDGVAHAGAPPAEAGSGSGGGKAAAPKPRPAGAGHSVFSLTDNRLLAHVQRSGGAVALMGSPGVAKYLHFAKPKITWKLKQKLEGKAVATADTYADIDLPLTASQADSAKSVWVRVHSPATRVMEVKVNGKAAGSTQLAAGWQTAQIALAAKMAIEGENRVQLVFGKGAAASVEWIQLGGSAAADDAPPFYDVKSKEIVIPKDGAVVWYVQVPEKGMLLGDVNKGCQVKVKAGSVEGTLEGAGMVDLSAAAGQITRLELTPLTSSSCAEARVANGELAVPGAAPKVTKDKKPKYIVFWIMDSLRADRVKPFWAKARPDVPNFEKLATKGAIFEQTYVQGNESRASHASIWSSLYPVNHRMITDKATLDTKWTTLGEAMKEAKFFTSGVSANGYIVKKKGFGDGWDAYRNHIHDGGGVRGEDIWKYAQASVEKKTKEPFFLYMGMIDTHVSWRAKEPWISKYSPKYNGKYKKEASGKAVEQMAAGTLKITEEDKQHIIAIYDSNVSYQDDLIGKVWAQLETWGIADDTMLVITADHGDEQWESGRVGHGGSLAESLIRVPLVIVYPPLFPAGTVVEGVDTIDILPTLLDAMGMSPPEEAQGESLIALAQGVGRGYPRPSIASQYENWHAMRLAGWKIKAGGTSVKLYHVADDPYEKADVVDSKPIERRFVTDAFSTFLVYQKDWKKARWGVASNASGQFASDLEK